MDHEQTYFLFKEVSSDKVTPAHMGLCVLGLQALPGDSGTNGESLALSNQTVSICPHPNGGEVGGCGQTCFWNLSSFLSHAPPYTCCSCTKPLPASEAFLIYPPLQQKLSGSSVLWICRWHIRQPVDNIEIFFLKLFLMFNCGRLFMEFRGPVGQAGGGGWWSRSSSHHLYSHPDPLTYY